MTPFLFREWLKFKVIKPLGLKDFLFDCPNVNKGSVAAQAFLFIPKVFLLTIQHVIEDADAVSVVTSDGKRMSAKVVKADAYKDLAIIKVDVSGAPHLTLGRSADVKVLDPVIR